MRHLPYFPCFDCRRNTVLNDYYMVDDSLWIFAIRAELREIENLGFVPIRLCVVFLCFHCLERRIGRKLVSSDFPPFICNEENAFVRRLRGSTE